MKRIEQSFDKQGQPNLTIHDFKPGDTVWPWRGKEVVVVSVHPDTDTLVIRDAMGAYPVNPRHIGGMYVREQ